MRIADNWKLPTGLALVLLAGAPVALAAEDAAAPTHQLRYQFQTGQAVYFQVHNETLRKFQHTVDQIELRDGSDSLKHYRVLSVDAEGQALLELTIDRTRMYAEQGSTIHKYDSTTDREPPEAFSAVNNTIGKPWLYVTVNNRGETKDFRTPAGAEIPESPDLISRVLPALPEPPVAIGDVWKEDYIVNVSETETLKKPIRMLRSYRLRNVENGLAEIELSTQVITIQKTPRQEAFLAQGLYTGSISLDVERGLLLERELHVNQTVVAYDGPQTVMSIVLSQSDAIAPQGAATPAPPARAAAVSNARAD